MDTVRGMANEDCKIASGVFRLIVGTAVVMAAVHLLAALIAAVLSKTYKVSGFVGKTAVAILSTQIWGKDALSLFLSSAPFS